MTGTTPGGLVYPLPSEPVRDGATRMQYFLEQLDQDPVERVAAAIGSQTIATATWEKAAWASSEYAHGSGFTLGPGGVQVSLAGRYHVEWAMLWPEGMPASRRGIGIGVTSGSAPAVRDISMLYYNTTAEQQMRMSTTLTLAATNQVTGWLWQQTGSSRVVDRTKFSLTIRRLRLGQAHA